MSCIKVERNVSFLLILHKSYPVPLISLTCLLLLITKSLTQIHILRDRQPGTTACPACWAMGKNELKYCIEREFFFTGLTSVAKAVQKSLVPER